MAQRRTLRTAPEYESGLPQLYDPGVDIDMNFDAAGDVPPVGVEEIEATLSGEPITLDTAKHMFEPKRRGGGRKRGCQPLWEDRMPNVVYHMRLLGADMQTIAAALSISRPTLETYVKTKPEMFMAWKAGGDLADSYVAKKLFHRATGYSHRAEKIHFDKTGGVSRADYVEHYPPDTQAAALWLANRQPKLWRSVNKVEVSNPDGSLNAPPSLTVNFVNAPSTTIIESGE